MQLTNSIFNQYGESLSLRGAKPRSNSFILFLSIILLAGNSSMVSGQERSAKVTKVEETIMGAIVNSIYGPMYVFGMPEKFIYTFENNAPVNLKMFVYIPQREYAQTIFPLTAAELKDRDDALSEIAKTSNTSGLKVVALKSAVDFRKTANAPTQSLRASSETPVMTELERWAFAYGLDDDALKAAELNLKATAFWVWESEVKSVNTVGTNNEVFFTWEYYTNRDQKVRPISDVLYYVLTDADTGKILDIIYLGLGQDLSIAAISLQTYASASDNFIVDTVFCGRDLQVAYFIVPDATTCDWLDGAALRKGLGGLADFYNRECIGGVVAYAYGDNVQGIEKAGTISNITWTPVAYGAQKTLNGTYHVIGISYLSFDENELTMGKGFPLAGAGYYVMTFNNFPLKAPTGIEGTVYTDDKVIIMKDGSRVTVTDRNSNPASSIALYDLSGRLVNIVSASSIPIPCSCNQVYVIRVVIGGKSVTQLVVL